MSRRNWVHKIILVINERQQIVQIGVQVQTCEPKNSCVGFPQFFHSSVKRRQKRRTFRSLSCRVFTSEVMVMSNHAAGMMERYYQGCENAGDRRRTEGWWGRRSFAPPLLNFSVRPCKDLKEDIECFHILKYKKYNVGESFGLSQEMLCIQKFTK